MEVVLIGWRFVVASCWLVNFDRVCSRRKSRCEGADVLPALWMHRGSARPFADSFSQQGWGDFAHGQGQFMNKDMFYWVTLKQMSTWMNKYNLWHDSHQECVPSNIWIKACQALTQTIRRRCIEMWYFTVFLPLHSTLCYPTLRYNSTWYNTL